MFNNLLFLYQVHRTETTLEQKNDQEFCENCSERVTLRRNQHEALLCRRSSFLTINGRYIEFSELISMTFTILFNYININIGKYFSVEMCMTLILIFRLPMCWQLQCLLYLSQFVIYSYPKWA